MRFQALPGFRDFYPDEMARRRWIEGAWHAAARAAGFQEIDGPVLESLELLTAKSGQQITGQLYAFTDKGGREVTLRPEMTPTLARMAGARASALPKPIKWYSVQQFFRYERPQRGRGREFFQWNADVLGTGEAGADAEVLATALMGLEGLGLTAADVVVRISDRRLLRRQLAGLEVNDDQERLVLACIDKLERDAKAPERLRELLGAPRAAELTKLCHDFPRADAAELDPVLVALEHFGLGEYVEPDFRIVRGLDYYTGAVWEIFDRTGKLRSIAGGGRYDGLIAQLGGPRVEALGFGMGDMTLGALLADRGLVPDETPRVEVFVVAIGEDMLGPARGVLRDLRRKGVSADALYAPARVGKALKAAQAAGASRAVLVGPDEWADGRVVVKHLDSGNETPTRLEDLY